MGVALEKTDEIKTLQEAIVRAVAFFDLFDRPLTPLEIHASLGVRADMAAVEAALAAGMSGLETAEGFYFLVGRRSNVAARKTEYDIAHGKFKRALRAARLLRYLPGVRLAAVCNNFNYKPESDIDLLIVTATDRLWSVRLLVTAVLHLARLRRHGDRIVDRICLSFYITEAALDLEPLTLDDDPYFYHWLARLWPVYDQSGTYGRLWEANNWLERHLPNTRAVDPVDRRRVNDSATSRFIRGISEFILSGAIGGACERLARALQWAKLARYTGKATAGDTRVVHSDTVLKFHENDRRGEYARRYHEKISYL